MVSGKAATVHNEQYLVLDTRTHTHALMQARTRANFQERRQVGRNKQQASVTNINMLHTYNFEQCTGPRGL